MWFNLISRHHLINTATLNIFKREIAVQQLCMPNLIDVFTKVTKKCVTMNPNEMDVEIMWFIHGEASLASCRKQNTWFSTACIERHLS